MKRLIILGMAVVVAVVSGRVLVRQPRIVAPSMELNTMPQDRTVKTTSAPSVTGVTEPDLQLTMEQEAPTPDMGKAQVGTVDNKLPETPASQSKQEPKPQPIPPAESALRSGDRNANGDIFVPGFGWIPDNGGGNTVTIAPNAGTGEIVGIMG